jgi:protein-S-isoprenylcysteine O-methyltransferase Ste14
MLASLELKIPPPIVALLTAGLMWLVTNKLGLISFDINYKFAICGFLTGLGLLIDLDAIRQFHQAKTTVNPMKPNSASALVTTGVYQYTRNPMYVGNFLFLSAWLIWLASPYNILCLALYVMYMNKFQIQPEELALRELFGEEYIYFYSRVRRWV